MRYRIGEQQVVDDAQVVVFLVFCLWFCFGGNFAMFPTNTVRKRTMEADLRRKLE